MSEWPQALPTRPLNSLVEIDPESLPGGTSPSFHFRYIDIAAVANGRLRLPDTETSYRDAPSRARRIIRQGDVLMSTVRPNLRAFAYCKLPSGDYIASTGFSVLRVIEGNDPRFILYSILSDPVAHQIESHAVGSNYPAINSSDVKRLKIPAFTPEQQRKIAEILGTVDEVIEQTEALIAKQQQMKAGLMHDLFTRGVTPDGQLRPSRSEAPDLYQETPLGWIPKEWVPDTIGGAFDSLIDGPFGSNLKTEHYVVEPGVRVVRLQNVGASKYDDSERAFISEAHAGFLLKNQVLPGDVLIAGLGEETHVVGRACCYPPDLPPAINKADCFRLRCRADKMLNAFAMFFMNTAGAQRQIRRYEQGVTRLRINTGNLRKIATGVPGIPEQAAIVQKLQVAIDQIESTHTHLAKLRQLKHGLMQDLLTGRVPVPA